MINVTALVQLKAFARQDGVILALTWIASFILMIYTPQYSYGNLLALSTPFIVGWRLCAFRNYALDGKISFRRGFAYSCYTFFYASLVFALCQYAYIKFIDGDSIKNMLAETVKVLTPVYQEQGLSLALALASRALEHRGAYRVHGGGFAGTIQAFVPDDLLDNYLQVMRSVFGQKSCYVLNIRPVGGTEIKA